jgi:hypothetical protein
MTFTTHPYGYLYLELFFSNLSLHRQCIALVRSVLPLLSIRTIHSLPSPLRCINVVNISYSLALIGGHYDFELYFASCIRLNPFSHQHAPHKNE